LGRGRDWGREKRKRARKEKWRARKGRGEEREGGREGQTPPKEKFWLRPCF